MVVFIFTKALTVALMLLEIATTVESRNLKGANDVPEEKQEGTELASAKLHRKAQQQQQKRNNANAFLPLKPPFRIIQIGEPRTGSTFQFQLLYAIADLKSPPNTEIEMDFISGSATRERLRDNKFSGESFVFKAHNLLPDTTDYVLEVLEEGNAFLFTSNNPESSQWAKNNAPLATSPHAVYTQSTADLSKCSLCEVDKYQQIFNLTDIEVANVKDYMAKFEIFRRCCGIQMSQYEMARLNGCDVSEFYGTTVYPNCEIYNKSQVEYELKNNPSGIRHRENRGPFHGENICETTDEIIANGTWFNFEPFEGCEHYGFKEKVVNNSA